VHNRFGYLSGDFNAHLYRPNVQHESSDIASLPWEFNSQLQSATRSMSDDQLRNLLLQYNFSYYKGWSTIADSITAQNRIADIVNNLRGWFNKFGASVQLEETLWSVRSPSRRQSKPEVGAPDASTWVSDRIDLIFVDENFRTENAFVVYSKADWCTLDTVSDHPGIVAVITWRPGQWGNRLLLTSVCNKRIFVFLAPLLENWARNYSG